MNISNKFNERLNPIAVNFYFDEIGSLIFLCLENNWGD